MGNNYKKEWESLFDSIEKLKRDNFFKLLKEIVIEEYIEEQNNENVKLKINDDLSGLKPLGIKITDQHGKVYFGELDWKILDINFLPEKIFEESNYEFYWKHGDEKFEVFRIGIEVSFNTFFKTFINSMNKEGLFLYYRPTLKNS